MTHDRRMSRRYNASRRMEGPHNGSASLSARLRSRQDRFQHFRLGRQQPQQAKGRPTGYVASLLPRLHRLERYIQNRGKHILAQMQLLLPQTGYLLAADGRWAFRKTNRTTSELSACLERVYHLLQTGSHALKIRIVSFVRHLCSGSRRTPSVELRSILLFNSILFSGMNVK